MQLLLCCCTEVAALTAHWKVAFPWEISRVADKMLEYGECDNIWHPVSVVILSAQTEHSQAMKVLIVLQFSWVRNYFSECDGQV